MKWPNKLASLPRWAAVALMCALGGPAAATPSQQVTIPSPDVVPQFYLHLDVDNTTTVLMKRVEGGHSRPVDLGMTLGLYGSHIFGMEVGLDLREATDFPLAYNIKVVMKENAIGYNTPAVVVGMYEMGELEAQTDLNIAYGLVSWNLPPVGRVAAGLYIGANNRLLDENGREEGAGFMLSFDRTLAELDDRLWLGIDYMSGAHQLGALSVGVAWRFLLPPGPGISAMVGYNIYNNVKMAGKNTVTIQFDIDIGR
ncbi:MAG: hypothetical protein OEZ32_01690 [Nitrospinota bacterium]|nr:hypothetical protein [Nitrospinota bacterium]